MKIYKHYSFDLWLTLIRSNPLFKTERAKFFYKNFNSKSKTMAEVITIFRQVDLMCNSINEKTGKNIDADEMYLMVISVINDFDVPFANIDITSLYDEMELLVLSNMPVLYSEETLYSLNELRQRIDCSFSISSNTAFIKGKTLRKVLSNLELSSFFAFQLYSDEIGVSKPDKLFFEIMLTKIKNIVLNKNISLNEIVHVGDNPKADIEGALSAGINGIRINSNNATIIRLLN